MSGLSGARKDAWERRLGALRVTTVQSIRGSPPREIVNLFHAGAPPPLPQDAEWQEGAITDEQVTRHVRLFLEARGFLAVAWDGSRPIGFALAATVRETSGAPYFDTDSIDETADVAAAFARMGRHPFGYVDTVVVGEEFRENSVGMSIMKHCARQFTLESVRDLVVRCPPGRDAVRATLAHHGFSNDHRYALREEHFFHRVIGSWSEPIS